MRLVKNLGDTPNHQSEASATPQKVIMDAVAVDVTQMLSQPRKFRALSPVAIAINAQSLIKGASSELFRSIHTPQHLVLISVFYLL
jgi:hypothetical protein